MGEMELSPGSDSPGVVRAGMGEAEAEWRWCRGSGAVVRERMGAARGLWEWGRTAGRLCPGGRGGEQESWRMHLNSLGEEGKGQSPLGEQRVPRLGGKRGKSEVP